MYSPARNVCYKQKCICSYYDKHLPPKTRVFHYVAFFSSKICKCRYNFEIKNEFGSVQGTVTLIVQEDNSSKGKEIGNVTEIAESLETNSVSQDKFWEYVAELHKARNLGFQEQYKVLPYTVTKNWM